MKKATNPNAPPSHLSAGSQAFWSRVVTDYELDEAPARELLRLCCEAMDRCEQARAQLERDGLTVTDRYGQTKPHPCAVIETQNRLAVARLLRELRVLEPIADDETRIPRVA